MNSNELFIEHINVTLLTQMVHVANTVSDIHLSIVTHLCTSCISSFSIRGNSVDGMCCIMKYRSVCIHHVHGN